MFFNKEKNTVKIMTVDVRWRKIVLKCASQSPFFWWQKPGRKIFGKLIIFPHFEWNTALAFFHRRLFFFKEDRTGKKEVEFST